MSQPPPDPPADDSPPTPGAAVRRGRRTARRGWLFRVAAVALSLLAVGLIEIALRLAGVGYDTRLIVRAREATSPHAYRFNPACDRAYYGREDLWGPDDRPFEIPKPRGIYRIVVVGGSSAAGFPYPFELAMPRQLELVLRRQAPGRHVEVLNAGMTAIMSSSEVDIVRQAIECQPDLLVVHSGHNEFYGPGGSASNESGLGPAWFGLLKFCKRQRLFQLIQSWLPRVKRRHLVEALPADIAIPWDGPVVRATEQRFRANLVSMVQTAQRHGVPILLSTIPCNLRDFAPLQPPSAATITRLREVDRALSYREFETALARLSAARAAAADPLLAYREAQCLEALGRRDQAAERYQEAANLDGCRFRAASTFNQTIRDVAAEFPAAAMLSDVDQQLRQRSRQAATGADYFLEHVHYNVEGNWEVASILGRDVVQQVWRTPWEATRHPSAEVRDTALELTMLDRLAAESLTLVGYQAWPFNLSPARGTEAAAMRARIQAAYQMLAPDERELFADLGMEALQQHLWLAMGEAWLARGDARRAHECLERHRRRRPWEPAAARLLAATPPAN